ncbi:MAG TPA: NADP-dependent oxidoreductase [Puia sp.]|nr:NADP-dependent oxidoreductase [Puia sp.]
MKAIQVHQYGGTDVLQLEEVPTPIPQDDEVLIQVKAAALNPADSKIRNGYLQKAFPANFPFIPGWEAAGIVSAVGKNITAFAVGDEVITRTPFPKGGGYAQYMTAAESDVIHKPASLSFPEAAALSIVGSAAYTALFRLAKLQAGQKLFILGASGAVGMLAAQMAQNAGATVITIADGHTDIDVALDLVGGPVQDTLWPLLKKDGLLISSATPPSQEKGKQYGVNATFMMTSPDRSIMELVAGMAAKGEIRLKVGKVLPLARAREAQELMEGRTIKGKIVLEP